MLGDVKPVRSIRWSAAIVAAVAGAAVLAGAAGNAQADNWKKHRHYYGGAPVYVVPPGHVRYYAPAPVVYAVPRPVVYAPAPAPVVVYPQPVQYAPAYPAYYGSPVGSLNIGVSVPLR